MNTQHFLQWLMDRSGQNANSLAMALRAKSLQGRIWSILHGEVRDPKRATLQPIADFFQVPIEAFYDSALADQVVARLDGKPAPPEQAKARKADGVLLSGYPQKLGEMLALVTDEKKQAVIFAKCVLMITGTIEAEEAKSEPSSAPVPPTKTPPGKPQTQPRPRRSQPKA